MTVENLMVWAWVLWNCRALSLSIRENYVLKPLLCFKRRYYLTTYLCQNIYEFALKYLKPNLSKKQTLENRPHVKYAFSALQSQCYRQWVYKAPLCITLRIKTWGVEYLKFIIFFFKNLKKKINFILCNFLVRAIHNYFLWIL